MGWLNAIGAVAGGVSALGNLFQQNQNKKMMREQMKYNTSEREASQQFQTSEREAMQGYQTSEREAQNKWTESIYNQYQSPQAMVKAMKEAGLNPLLALDQSSIGSVGASSGSSGGAPSSSSPRGSSISAPYQSSTNFASGFQDMAAAASALAQAKKSGVETDQLEGLFSSKLRQENARAAALEIESSNMVKFLDKKSRAELSALLQNIEVGKATVKEKDAIVDHLRSVKGLNDKQIESFDKTLQSALDNQAADTDLKKRQISYLDVKEVYERSAAALNGSYVLTERSKRELNESMSEINKVLKRVYNSDAYVAENTKDNRVILSDHETNVLREQIDYLHALAEKARKDGDYYEFGVINEFIGSVTGLAFGAAAASKLVGGKSNPVGFR